MLGQQATLRVFGIGVSAATSDVLEARQHAELQITSSAPQGRHDALFDVDDRTGGLPDLTTWQVAVRQTVAVASGWTTDDEVTARFADASRQRLVIGALFDGGITTDWIGPPTTAEGRLADASREAFVRLDGDVTVEQLQPRGIPSATSTVELTA